MAKHIPRIYCPDLNDEFFEIPDFQITHLISVLRLKDGDNFFAFNQEKGEWLCSILSIKKRGVTAKRVEFQKEFQRSNFLALAFSLIKPDNMRLIIEKGTELGVTDFYPLITKYTNSKLNIKKLESIAILASEQSERIDIPQIHEEIHFENFIMKLPDNFAWISAIERKQDISSLNEIDMKNKNIGFIIGPEGGFSDLEKDMLSQKTIPSCLSSNILRSETAAIACLSVYNTKNV